MNVEDLDRPEGNDLQSNYLHHDSGEQAFLELLPPEIGVQWYGIDRRDDDSGELIYDDKPDFKLWKHGELVALVDIKAKNNDDYMGLYNERHYHKYVEKADEYGIPVWVFMISLDGGSELWMAAHDGDDDVYLTSEHDFMLTFPDHNSACYICESERVTFDEFINQL